MVSSEQRLADEIMKAVRRLKLPLRCDNLTEALGDCFPLSVLQQLNRPEIFKELSTSLKKIVFNKNQSKLRQEISNFMVTSRHPRLIDYKKQFEGGIGPLIKLTWDEYWTKMMNHLCRLQLGTSDSTSILCTQRMRTSTTLTG